MYVYKVYAVRPLYQSCFRTVISVHPTYLYNIICYPPIWHDDFWVFVTVERFRMYLLLCPCVANTHIHTHCAYVYKTLCGIYTVYMNIPTEYIGIRVTRAQMNMFTYDIRCRIWYILPTYIICNHIGTVYWEVYIYIRVYNRKVFFAHHNNIMYI